MEKIAPNKAAASRTVAEGDKDVDLAAAAAKVADAQTPHRADKAPNLAVTLFAKMDKDKAKAAEEELGKVKGVDAKETKANAEKGEISVRFKGDKGPKAADLLDAAKKAGVEASLTKK